MESPWRGDRDTPPLMKVVPLLLLSVLCFASCEEKDGSVSSAPAGKAEARAKRPDPQLVAAYRDGMESLRGLKARHAELKADELAISGGRNYTNMALLRELEGSIALLETDLAKMKIKIDAPR